MSRLAFILYDLSILILSPFVLLAFSLVPRGRFRLKERLGWWELKESQPLIWFHAASLGEVRGLRSVIVELRKRLPDHKILVSSTSDTGVKAAEEVADYSKLMPFDSKIFLALALSRIKSGIQSENKIRALIISETELWPGLIRFARRCGIKLLLINARVSKNAFGRYLVFKPLIAQLLECFSLVAASGRRSAERLSSLGAKNVEIIGNSKYQGGAQHLSPEERESERLKLFGNTRPAVILGSLRPGEEQPWFQAIKGETGINLIVAPRHLERLSYFRSKLNALSIPYKLLSERQPSEVLLVDKYGVLERLYAVSDLAFIGGTLLDYGGHTPLEAARAGCMIVVGPHQDNIEDIINLLVENGAAREVCGLNDIMSVLDQLKSDLSSVALSGQRAAQVAGSFDQTAAKVTEQILRVL